MSTSSGTSRRPAGRRSSPGSGTRPTAPSLCLMGHTDVVPVHADGWRHDPFGGELIRRRGVGPRRGRHAQPHGVDGRRVPRPRRPRVPATGDLLYFAVADEEAGSAHGARWVADHHPDAIRCDYLLTESGGLHDGPPEAPGSASPSARRVWRGGGCGCAARRARLDAVPHRQRARQGGRRRAAPRRVPAGAPLPRAVAGQVDVARPRRRPEGGAARPGARSTPRSTRCRTPAPPPTSTPARTRRSRRT